MSFEDSFFGSTVEFFEQVKNRDIMPPKKSNLKKPGTAGRGQPRPRGQQAGQQVDPYNQQVRDIIGSLESM